MQRLVVVSRRYRKKGSWSRKGVVGLQGRVGGDVYRGIDQAIAFDLHRNGQCQRYSFHMSDCFSYLRIPEGNDRDTSAIAAFNYFAHCIDLRESILEFENVIFAPINARALISPHVIRFAADSAVETMLLLRGAVHLDIR